MNTFPTTHRPTWATSADTHTCEQDEVCSCGQELDCCTHEHCPRCGRTLHPVWTQAVA